jgi:N utilization substance protein A
MNELNGEKIDIIDFSEDPATYVANALAPAKVTSVEIVDLEMKSAKVVVPDYQLSLAIGKDGQNARLAARLTQGRIDIHPDNPVTQIKAPVVDLPEVNADIPPYHGA